MEEYKPPIEGRSSKKYLLLDFNEMTTETSPQIKKALKKFISSKRLQIYPEYKDLNKKIAAYAKVKPSRVMTTNGSDQGIDIILRAILSQNDKVIIPTPSFAMFYQSAQIQEAKILKPLYKKDLSFPTDKVLNLIDKNVKLIIICNPNNPTGTPVSNTDLLKILKKAKNNNTAVMQDEAYFEFSGITAKNLIDKYDNLFITRTFSKTFGIASIRAAYILSQEKNIKQLLKIRGPYDVNMFAKTAILAALDDINYMKNYTSEVMQKSKPKLEKFFREKGVEFYKSAANFLLIKSVKQQKICRILKSKDILVRPRNGPNIDNTIRISIGTAEETKKFIDIFSKMN